MDLTRDVTYRGFLLNDEDIRDNLTGIGLGNGIAGCVLDSADLSDIDLVQYVEKRSQSDGSDVGDAHYGIRRIRISGTLYGTSRAELYDRALALRAALNAVLAQREEPADKGYRPLYFSQPTLSDLYDDNIIEQRMLVMPRQVQMMFARDHQGGDDTSALAIPWQATLISRDGAITGAEPQEYNIQSSGDGAEPAGDVLNRGTYLGVVNAIWYVGSGSGDIVASIGDSTFTITVPSSSGNRIIRFKGADKVLTVEEDGTEVPRMDLIDFDGDSTWPLVDPGTSAYEFEYNSVTPGTGTLMWFYEQYA